MKEVTFNNIKFIVGNSAKENWEILEEALQTDVWFHLDGFPSSYVIMKAS